MDSTVDLASSEIVLQNSTLLKYKNAYTTFLKWQESKGITSFDEDSLEDILLDYFNEVSKTYKSSTLWSMYSKLKSTISHYNHIDISANNSRLIAFLKEKAVGYQCEKFKVFTAEEINKFLVEAPDEHYLAMKTVLLFGVAGGCRGDEITKIKIDYVTDYGTEVIVNIPNIKKNSSKVFLISGEFAKIVQKYMQLRPANIPTDRFFLQYQQGECLRQVIGKNKIAIVPKEIAKFLKLDAYKSYNGHSFRPTILSNSGIDIIKSRWIESTESAEDKPHNSALNKSHASKRQAASTNTNSTKKKKKIAQIQRPTIVQDADHDVFFEIKSFNEQETEMSSETIMPMLPLTIALMKRKPEYYMGVQKNQLARLLQLASEKNQLSDLKLMLALRKLRLKEEFEVLGDLFDLDAMTTERYYHESKHTAIDLVDLLTTTIQTPNFFQDISEPIIKIEESDAPYVLLDPIASENDDSNTEMEDHDDFEFSLPVSDEDDRGFLSNDIKKRTAECSVCHKLYAPRLLNAHMESVHLNLLNLNKTICGLCWKTYDTEVLLKSHQKDAHGGGCYGCDVCGKTFASKRYISVHILTKHAQVKTYLCDTCGEGFPVQSSLKSHVIRKHVERGHDCHLCDMKFVTGRALKDHYCARHTNTRPYKCEVKGCGKTFGWPSAFKSHKRVHAQDKYECSICSKLFSFKGNLQNHLRTIHNQIVNNNCLTSKIN